MAALAPEKVYPVVRRFLVESGLRKTLKSFDKDTATEDDEEAPAGKKAKLLAKLELTVACSAWLAAHKGINGEALVASEVYPIVRKFLEDGELGKSLAAFDKETSIDDAAEAPASGKKAKALRKLDLAEACGEWLKAQKGDSAAKDDAVEPAPQKDKKRKVEEEAAAAPKVEEVPQKRAKMSKEERANKPKGEAFKRVDDDAWRATITDSRLLDNTHLSKAKFGSSAGDSWADAASEDMLKVKGKGFRKEMAKKKRASWKGAGELDQGVNSIKFADNSDTD